MHLKISIIFTFGLKKFYFKICGEKGNLIANYIYFSLSIHSTQFKIQNDFKSQLNVFQHELLVDKYTRNHIMTKLSKSFYSFITNGFYVMLFFKPKLFSLKSQNKSESSLKIMFNIGIMERKNGIIKALLLTISFCFTCVLL